MATKHTLYFTKELAPNSDELSHAETLDGNVTFRCIKYVDVMNLEPADEVAGSIPGVYADAKTGEGGSVYKIASETNSSPVSTNNKI